MFNLTIPRDHGTGLCTAVQVVMNRKVSFYTCCSDTLTRTRTHARAGGEARIRVMYARRSVFCVRRPDDTEAQLSFT